MRYLAVSILAVAALCSAFLTWRAGMAARDRDAQTADFNDVVVAITLCTSVLVLALLGVVTAVLS